MKNVLTIVLVVADAVLLVLSLLMFVAGYPAWGVVALLAAGGLVYAAARFWLNSPEPPAPVPAPVRRWLVLDEELEDQLSAVEQHMLADPVDEHAAQAIRALSGQPAVLPEMDLLLPNQPGCGRHRRLP